MPAYRAFHVDEAVVGRGIEVGVVAAVIVIAVRPGAGLDLALGIAAVGGELREQNDVRRVGRVPDADAAQARPLFDLFDQVQVVVLAVGRGRSGGGDRRGSTRDEDPFAELPVVGDLQLRAPEG